MRITVGAGKANPHGEVLALSPAWGRVEALAEALADLPSTKESWWTPAAFGPSPSCDQPKAGPLCLSGATCHRKSDAWLSSCAVGVDLDSKGHAEVTDEQRVALDAFVRDGGHGANIAHHSPHGARLVFVLDSECVDRATVDRAHEGAAALVQAALAETNAADHFELDAAATGDVTRGWYAPQALVNAHQRDAEVITLHVRPAAIEDLASHAPELLRTARPPTHAPGAVQAFRAAFPQDWPSSSGTCPACGHDGCFGRLPSNPDRWACFSANHERDSGGCGLKGKNCWTGDYIDLVAQQSGSTRARVLFEWRQMRAEQAEGLAAESTPAVGQRDDSASQVAAPPAKVLIEALRLKRHPAQELTMPGGEWSGYYELSDRGNALRLGWHLTGKVRWCGDAIGWLRWSGKHWERGDLVESMIREVVLKQMRPLAEAALASISESMSLKEPEWAQRQARFLSRCGSAAARQAALRDLRDLGAIRTPPSDLDPDPYLLTVANGTIELRTGVLRPHDPSDLITHCIPVAFDPHARCERWDRFMMEVTDGDDDFVAFLHRAFGFVLVGEGSRRTKAFLYFYGPPNSGKGTIISVLEGLLGPTLWSGLSWGSLAAATTGGPNSEIAQLEGKRLGTIADTGGTPRWDAETLKKLTGGDHVTCSEKNKPAFSYRPRATLIIAGNDRPRIAGAGSQAIRDRIRTIPLRTSFSEDEEEVRLGRACPADGHLKTRLLETEAAGILAWLVRGAQAYLAEGLGTCRAVNAERKAWTEDDKSSLEELLEAYTITGTDADAQPGLGEEYITAHDLWHALRVHLFDEGMSAKQIESEVGEKRRVSREVNKLRATSTRYRFVRRGAKKPPVAVGGGKRSNAWSGIAWRAEGSELLARHLPSSHQSVHRD